MVLIPKKTKYRFNHYPKYEGPAKGNHELHEGDFGLQALVGTYLNNRAIESTRRVISPLVRKYKWKLQWKVFPHWGKTKKAIGGRMGSGKGSIEEWVAVVKAGTIILEVIIPENPNLSPKEIKEEMQEARQALKGTTHKLPKGKKEERGKKKWRIVEKNPVN